LKALSQAVINLKLLSGKNTQKSKQTKYSGFVKLGVQ
jgi:hypothetical protein